LLAMHGEARYDWRHGFDATTHEMHCGQVVHRSRRVGLTLRRLCDTIELGQGM
jgi:hypothetical protein